MGIGVFILADRFYPLSITIRTESDMSAENAIQLDRTANDGD